MDFPAKQALFSELLARLRKEHETLVAAQKAAHEGATHEEARPENDKDTRALEQSYLARGQAERVAQLEQDVLRLTQLVVRSFGADDAIALGAWIRAEDDEKSHLYLLAPAGAGETLQSNEGPVKIVTPSSPLGRALSGAAVDDDIQVRSPTGKRLLSIVEIG
jgi:transcription elongation GreA/GreB family factor